ncbi:MAG: hypothetical protein ACKOAD_08095 [Gammaproteobacteria bacterium]
MKDEATIAEAKDWLLKAAKKDIATAQNDLGRIYEEEGNLAEAKKWYEKAAKQGLQVGQYNF